MRKNLVSVALMAVLATMAVSCQKESFTDQNLATAEIGAQTTVNYTVDGVAQQAILHSEAERDALFDYLMTLVEQGHNVAIEGNGECGIGTKDVQTIVTEDKEEAKDWAKEKNNEGYNVNISNNGETYTVVAVKP